MDVCLCDTCSYCLFSLCLALNVALCFPLCGLCSFVQLELDWISLPGGERVMVLLSSRSEMDSSARARV